MEKELIKSLKVAQKDLVERLSSTPESINHISVQTTKEINSFCWAMAYKYAYKSIINNPNKVESLQNKHLEQEKYLSKHYFRQLIGKLGEVAVKEFLQDLTNDVNYEIQDKGDGGFDLHLSDNPEVRIQVRTRNGRFDEIAWAIGQKELTSNTILICVYTQDSFEKCQDHDKINYRFLIAGFLPNYIILEMANKGSIQTVTTSDGSLKFNLKIENLLHYQGLKNYLKIVSDNIWQAIQVRSSEVYQQRLKQLIVKPELKLQEFNSIMKQAYEYFSKENFQNAIEVCDRALSKYEEYYSVITTFLVKPDLNFKSKNSTLAKFKIEEIRFPGKQIIFSHNYRLVLPVYQLRGVSRLRQKDFEGAWSDFLIFILLENNSVRMKEFPLTTHYSSSCDVEGYSLTSTNVLAYHNQGYALLGLLKYDRAAKHFDKVIDFLSTSKDIESATFLATAHKFRGDIYKVYQDYERAVECYNQAIQINPKLAEIIVSENEDKLKILSVLKVELL